VSELDLQSIAADLVALARKAGADSCDALCAAGEGTDVEVRHGAIEKLERTESQVLGLRVFVGQNSAIASGSVTTSDAMRRLAENAIAMAREAPPDPFAGIAPTEMLAGGAADLDLYTEQLPSSDALKGMALKAEEAARGVPGVTKSEGSGASAGRSHVALATSAGFAGSYRRSSVSLYASAISGEGTAMETDSDFSVAIHPEDLRSPLDVGRTAGERAAAKAEPRKIASQAVPIVYDRRVSSSLLGHLSSAINGAAIARGTGFLKDAMGEQLFASNITIIDDPLRKRGLASKPFDGEGLAVSRRDMIAKGVLTGWFLDLRAARQLGLTPTGNGVRGAGSPPSPSSSNLHLEPGSMSRDEMIKGMGKGLLVTSMLGSSINPVTGDYSRGASGFWIENGEIAFPVSEITIAGNLKDMFRTLVPASDLEFRSSTNAPSCLVEGMTVAGT
jgi:PmbA protein